MADKKDNPLISFSDSELALIKSEFCKPRKRSCTNNEFKLFVTVCETKGLNPLLQEVHAIFRSVKDQNTGKYDEKMSIQTGIDGFRATAARTKVYAGSDEPKFTYVIDPINGKPTKQIEGVSVTVYKIVGGIRCPFSASAFWEEYYPGNNASGMMWRKRPKGMLGKCGEALALRKAFPTELSGLYTDDEMIKVDSDAEHTQEISEKCEKMDYGEQTEQIEAIKELLGVLTDGKSLKDKGKFLIDCLEIGQFNDLRKKDNDELDQIYTKLKKMSKA